MYSWANYEAIMYSKASYIKLINYLNNFLHESLYEEVDDYFKASLDETLRPILYKVVNFYIVGSMI